MGVLNDKTIRDLIEKKKLVVYDHTRIESPHGDINISTAKRTLSELLLKIRQGGRFHIVWAEQLRANNLRFLPTKNHLRTIDRSGQRAIAHIIMLRRLP